MKSITIEQRQPVNLEALDEQLAALLGTRWVGVSAGGGQIILYVADDTPPADLTQARAVLESHDPARLSSRQQAEAAQQHRLEEARRDYKGDEIDPGTVSDPQIQLLARKIAWLEREIDALRAGL